MITTLLIWKNGQRTTAEIADETPPEELRVPAQAGIVTLQTDQEGAFSRSRSGTAVFRFSGEFDDGRPLYVYENTELV
ncbi:hypothetical protein [Amycolatopsis thailandensis]|uniref:hypothetical protein n=1 Tax=Amycolatopsis thailandensis TaxID=589330 RepID=UPI00362777E9